ncbi:MAG: hypothetical protein JKY67_23055 [Pseudomonadales bacterium]|nr:hypothetical protein [Pseudomonadales bacterium]PCJ56208.1 MAG: hypothetical protein COA79_19330 [Planctomycetota bacterium]
MTPKFIDKLEKRFRFLQIKNLPVYIVAGQAFFYIALITEIINPDFLILAGRNVMSGEVIGIIPLILYPFIPPMANPILVLFALYITFLVSKHLEESWGSFKFTFYVFLSYVVIVGTCFAIPNIPVYSEVFFSASLFIAFAYVTPNFVFHLLLLFPIKVKWLGLLTWLLLWYVIFFAEGMLSNYPGELVNKDAVMVLRLQAISAMLPFFVFFGNDLLLKLKQKRKRSEFSNMVKVVEGKGRHQCINCSRTELTDPELEFRYKEVEGDLICYCIEHVPNN